MTAASRLRPRDPYADDPPEAARQRLIHRLITVVGDGLTRVAAQEVLEHARAWTGRSMRQLDQHFADHPDALADPDAHAPPCLARVAYRLIDIGVGQAVQPPRCVQCGLAKREMVRGHPHPDGAGRCCGACLRHLTEIDCVRCGRRGPRAPGERRG